MIINNMESTTKRVAKKNKTITLAEYEKQVYDLKQLLEISKSLCSVLEVSTLIDSLLLVLS